MMALEERMDGQVEATLKLIQDATAGMSPDDLSRHPEGKWCAAEIVEHLLITYTATTAGLRKVLAKGKPLARKPTLKDRVFQFAVLGVTYFPTGRKAPEATLPKGLDPAQVVRAVSQALPDMEAAIADCEKQFGKVRIADHPVLGPLTPKQWRTFHYVHARHHMKQVERLRSLASPSHARAGA
jgi:hypothetical protein